MFQDYAPEQMETLKRAAEKFDQQTVRDTAHRLAGAAANLSAVTFVQAARELEAAAQHDVDQMKPLVRDLEAHFNRLQSVIQQLI